MSDDRGFLHVGSPHRDVSLVNSNLDLVAKLGADFFQGQSGSLAQMSVTVSDPITSSKESPTSGNVKSMTVPKNGAMTANRMKYFHPMVSRAREDGLLYAMMDEKKDTKPSTAPSDLRCVGQISTT